MLQSTGSQRRTRLSDQTAMTGADPGKEAALWQRHPSRATRSWTKKSGEGEPPATEDGDWPAGLGAGPGGSVPEGHVRGEEGWGLQGGVQRGCLLSIHRATGSYRPAFLPGRCCESQEALGGCMPRPRFPAVSSDASPHDEPPG